jgi:transposase
MTNYREILRLHSRGISQRSIAAGCQCSRNTVAKVLARAKEVNLKYPLQSGQTNDVLEQLLFPDTSASVSKRHIPDLEKIDKEMIKAGVTLRLIWIEYCTECRLSNKQPLMYSQFCYHYQKYAEKKRVTMSIHRKPGEQIEVDWAGQTGAIVNDETGGMIPVYIFVAVLSYSHYAYVEAFFDRKLENWIAAHVNMFRYFNGVSQILIPDNLKTGVKDPDRYEPAINKAYQEMAEHYNTVILPARIKKPKDKPSVEGAVGNISTWILAALRHEKHFSLGDLNRDIHQKLEEFNRKPFQKKDGSRQSVFFEQEKAFLLPLPKTPYELATWKIATVQINYHVTVDRQHYSVYYEYVKSKVDVRITRHVIEVFINGHRICSHRRLYGAPGQYSTVVEHMPPDHKAYVQWNAERFIDWSSKIGPNTQMTVKAILSSHKIQQQAYRSCLGLLKLADKHSVERLEAACEKALFYSPVPSYKSVKTILSTGQDKVLTNPELPPTQHAETYGFTRGAEYYGRIKK